MPSETRHIMDTAFAEVEERRKHRRLNFRFPMRYRLLPQSEDSTEHRRSAIGVLTRDIGTGGLRFVSERFIPKSARLLVESPPLSPHWRIKAEVCWIQKMAYNERYNIGLSFQDGDKEVKEILNLYSE